MKLLERDALLSALQLRLQQAVAGRGALVFLEGEAGIGKTSLLRAFADLSRGTAVAWGACDALQTPRPLAPLFDIAAEVGGELQATLDGPYDRMQVFRSFLDLLGDRTRVVFLEDLHWADEATLDLLRFVGRRIDRTRSLVVATLRSDELGASHPLRLAMGDLATSGALRLPLPPLSAEAVRELAGDREIDAGELHRLTGGNPFYVTEVLEAGGRQVPASVRDAVLSRAARLRPSARAILDVAAVAGPRVEPWLLKEVTGAESAAVEEALDSGILREAEGLFVFRHELARQAILLSISATRVLALHRLVLQALQSLQVPAAPAPDPARLAHHAVGAGDSAAVLRFAKDAARKASAQGAHRQAAQQLARALEHVSQDPAEAAVLLDDYAAESHLSGEIELAIEARREAGRRWQEARDPERRAITLARMAHLLVLAGRNSEAETVMQEARSLVAPGAKSAAAVETRRWSAYLRMLDRDLDEAVRDGTLAMGLAQEIGDSQAVMQCLNTIGSSLIVAEQIDEGIRQLETSLQMATEARAEHWVATALTNLGSACGEIFRFDVAEPYLRRAIAYCAERDLDYSRLYASAWLATVELYLGRWTEAAAMGQAVLADRRSSGISRMMALIAVGRVRARRGDPGVWEALDAARELVDRTGTLQRLAPMRAARAEAASLEGRDRDAADEAAGALALAVRKRHPWFASELNYWRYVAQPSSQADPPPFCARHPFSLELDGCWREAAAAWQQRGCVWESGRALALGNEAAQREALAIFESLGSVPMIERVKRRLRAAGVRGLRRGPREATRTHPAGLTKKEVAVLTLLAEGLRSKEIALRLNRSVRTVDHHLESIFEKLGASTRSEAVSTAYRLGVVPVRGEPRDRGAPVDPGA